MRSTFNILFYVNKSKEKNGVVPVMGRVTINGTQSQFSCKKTIPLDMWDVKGNCAKGRSKEALQINRELDNIKDDDELERFRKRLVDRFGPVPEVGEELMRVVRLRRMAKSLGCEKIMLKMGRMTMILVSNNNSAYYQSNAFDMMLSYVASNPRRCNLREANGKRSMVVSNVTTVAQAVEILETITGPKPCADI